MDFPTNAFTKILNLQPSQTVVLQGFTPLHPSGLEPVTFGSVGTFPIFCLLCLSWLKIWDNP